ncbi:Detected protein of unknown function [Hibiscus syriacus]|uniref:Uncharacterized protein n=1 Tax=Hibiscus syriacus TaxID=106335 RepID=A0A6A2YYB8_HIBSY|nr:nuclear transport factor 2-like [Hibiscus syriacus]KAE8684426.1 Detected protein of unknown function [Hibiscus syriacus]
MDAKSSVCSTPQEAGAVFVDRYYLVLRDSPEEIHKFYNDSSMVSRPGPDDIMATFTTIQHIKKHLLSSFGCKQFHIVSCDSQLAANQGVFVVVTEWITPNVSTSSSTTDLFLEEDFSTSDVSKAGSSLSSHDIPAVSSSVQEDTPAIYVEDVSSVVWSPHQDVPTVEDVSIVVQSDVSTLPVADDSTTVSSLAQHDEPSLPIEDVPTFHTKDVPTSKHEVETTPVKDVSSIVSNSTQHDGPTFCMEDFPAIISNSTCRVPIDHIPKKSFSSVVQVLNENDAQFKPPPIRKSVRVLQEPKKSGLEGENKNMNTGNVKADGTSIFVGNLATGSKPEQLHEAFKRFGPIKSNGVQIKLDRLYRSYAFVQFESSRSAKAAVQASFIKIGNRKLNIKEKHSY